MAIEVDVCHLKVAVVMHIVLMFAIVSYCYIDSLMLHFQKCDVLSFGTTFVYVQEF